MPHSQSYATTPYSPKISLVEPYMDSRRTNHQLFIAPDFNTLKATAVKINPAPPATIVAGLEEANAVATILPKVVIAGMIAGLSMLVFLRRLWA